jgi:hypothetical protein
MLLYATRLSLVVTMPKITSRKMTVRGLVDGNIPQA